MSVFLRFAAALMLMALVSACAAPNQGGSSPDEISRAAYRHNGPTRLTLYTMLSNSSGAGAHTSLMINASQRVAFDPAGSFRHEGIVSYDDVVFGMTPYLEDKYTRFHARKTYHVVVQQIDVSPEVAELAMQKAIAKGSVPQAHCALATSELIASLPGFEDVKTGYYPRKLMDAFAAKGATMRRLYEQDSDDKSKVLVDFVPEYELKARAAN